MNLYQVPTSHIDKAWKDGAHHLSKACERASREITADQLKMMLARGERALFGLWDGEKTVAWAVLQIQQLPNVRVLYVYSIYAPGYTGPECFEHLKRLAHENGCSVIRGSCNDAISRLWEMKFKAKKVYQVMEIEL